LHLTSQAQHQIFLQDLSGAEHEFNLNAQAELVAVHRARDIDQFTWNVAAAGIPAC
jgi:hypothetical protein